MKHKHTPGPWYIIENGGEVDFLIEAKNNAMFDPEITIAYIEVSDSPECNLETSKANLHLIAAAPELLEALELAANILRNAGQRPSAHNNLGIIDQALKKARGES